MGELVVAQVRNDSHPANGITLPEYACEHARTFLVRVSNRSEANALQSSARPQDPEEFEIRYSSDASNVEVDNVAEVVRGKHTMNDVQVRRDAAPFRIGKLQRACPRRRHELFQKERSGVTTRPHAVQVGQRYAGGRRVTVASALSG